MHTIISKRPTAFVYTKWSEFKNGVQTAIASITIDGGAGVVNPRSLVTPQGVATFIDDKTLGILKTIPKFNRDLDRGIIRIEDTKISDPEKIDNIADSKKMVDNADIPARPITPEDLENDGAVINDDGSVNIVNGGKDAVTRRKNKTGKKTVNKRNRH